MNYQIMFANLSKLWIFCSFYFFEEIHYNKTHLHVFQYNWIEIAEIVQMMIMMWSYLYSSLINWFKRTNECLFKNWNILKREKLCIFFFLWVHFLLHLTFYLVNVYWCHLTIVLLDRLNIICNKVLILRMFFKWTPLSFFLLFHLNFNFFWCYWERRLSWINIFW